MAPSPSLDVVGRVVGGSTGAGQAGLEVRLRGARGALVTTSTDAAGAFSAAGVAAPYDLVVCRGVECEAYLEVSRADVRVPIGEQLGLPYVGADITVPVLAPACGIPPCTLHVKTATPAALVANGDEVGSYTSAGTQKLTVRHEWVFEGVTPPMVVDVVVNVLVRDAQSTRFFHARAAGQVTAGGGLVLPTVVPAELATAGALTFDVQTRELPPTWITKRSVWLAYPGGEGLAILGAHQGRYLLPLLPGAFVMAQANAFDPDDDEDQFSVSASQDHVSLTTATIPFSLVGPPRFTRPANHGSLATNEALSWIDPSGSSTYELRLVGQAGPRVTVRTAATTLDLRRLDTLGLRWAAGPMFARLRSRRPGPAMDQELAVLAVGGPPADHVGAGSASLHFDLAP